MKEDWEKLYRSVVVERNPTLKQWRIQAAYKAVKRRIKEAADTAGAKSWIAQSRC